MSDCIHVGDVGTLFRVRILDCDTGEPEDISGATVKEIRFKKPTGVILVKTATFSTDGIDGYIQYMVISGDLDMSGTWEIEGYVEGVGFKNTSSKGTFYVADGVQ